MKLITGSSNPTFAAALQQATQTELVQVECSYFSNSEKRIWITDQIQGENVIFVQSFSNPTDEHIIEFLLIADALERLGARHVNAVIPWMGYSFQDKVFRTGEPIAAKVVANLVSNSYTKRAFLLDIHNSSVPGFFSIPTANLTALNLFATYVSQTVDMATTVVASPDFGGLKRARQFADTLGVPLVNIDKQRDLSTGKVSVSSLQGDSVENKTILIFDDAILSGSTVLETSKLLKSRGAKEIYFLATHPVFTPGAEEKLADPSIDRIIVTNSIAHASLPSKVTVLDCAPLFAEALKAWM